jgi:hypothetical protein
MLSNLQPLRLVAIKKISDGKTTRSRIGVPWRRENGKDFNVQLDFFPAAG